MQWKDIPEFEGLYQINEKGEVKSLKRVVQSGRGSGIRTIPEKILKPFKDKKGCIKFQLFKNNKRTVLSLNSILKKLGV